MARIGWNPANWFILQGDQAGEGATSIRGHSGYQALLSKPPARLEVRREFFSNRVVDEYNRLPDRVKMAANMNVFKARLDEHLGTPAPLQWRGRRGQTTPGRRGESWTSASGLKTIIASIICHSICGPLDYIPINKDH